MNRAAIAATATAFGRQLGMQGAVSRYRDARRWLHTPASRQSRLGLDWTNFFIADVQAGFGTFVAFYLASLGWSQTNIGLALGTGGFAGVLALIPGGALADAANWKRGLAAAGILMICSSALILAWSWRRRSCTARRPVSSPRPSPPSASAWSGAARCRCEPDAMFDSPPPAPPGPLEKGEAAPPAAARPPPPPPLVPSPD